MAAAFPEDGEVAVCAGPVAEPLDLDVIASAIERVSRGNASTDDGIGDVGCLVKDEDEESLRRPRLVINEIRYDGDDDVRAL